MTPFDKEVIDIVVKIYVVKVIVVTYIKISWKYINLISLWNQQDGQGGESFLLS